MNNQPKFDPITGEPLQNNIIPEPVVPINEYNTNVEENQTINNPQNEVLIQTELHNIPTIEQNKEQFIENIQSTNQEIKENKKEGTNFIFIIIIFIIMLAAILFIFPLLLNYM